MTIFSNQFRFSSTYFDNTIKGDTFKVTVYGKMLLDSDMPDFDDFKKFVKNNIINKLDNAFLYNKNIGNNEQLNNILALIMLDDKQKTFAFDSDVNMLTVANKILKTLNFCAVMENKDYRIYSVEIYKSKSQKIIVTDED